MPESLQFTIDAESIVNWTVRLAKQSVYWVLLLVAAAGTAVATVLAADATRPHRAWWITGAAVGAMGVLALPEARRHFQDKNAKNALAAADGQARGAELRAAEAESRATAAEDLAVDLQTRFNSSIGDVIPPIASELAGLAHCSREQAAERRGAVLQQIVDAAVTMCGGEGVRAALYTLGMNANGKSGDLHRKQWAGRHDPPRLRFKKGGDARERAVHDLVRKGAYDLQEDVGLLDDRSLYRGKQYHSFVAVAVKAGSEGRGMLAVDAPQVRRFDRTHLGILLALQGLIAIALSLQDERVDADS